LWNVDPQQLVDAFFKNTAALDGEVNSSPQVRQIGVGLVFYLQCLLFLVFLVIGLLVAIAFLVAFFRFSQNFGL